MDELVIFYAIAQSPSISKQYTIVVPLFRNRLFSSGRRGLMFPYRRPPRNPFFPQQQKFRNPYSHLFFDYFRKNDGMIDFDKIAYSLQQINKIMKQADPLVKQVTSFVKKSSKS